MTKTKKLVIICENQTNVVNVLDIDGKVRNTGNPRGNKVVVNGTYYDEINELYEGMIFMSIQL